MNPKLLPMRFGLALVAFTMPLVPLAMAADDVRLNQIQVIGSHNSYHIEPSPAVRALIAATGEEHAQGLEYTHPPLAEQFSDRGIRQIELDLFHDPEGGRYAEPAARRIVRGLGRDPGPDHDPRGCSAGPASRCCTSRMSTIAPPRSPWSTP